jgi:hypothetical protein
MDFKGHFPIAGQRCYPLTVLDDHSRNLMGLQACESPEAAINRRLPFQESVFYPAHPELLGRFRLLTS